MEKSKVHKNKKINKKGHGVHFDVFAHPRKGNKNINKFEVTFDESSRRYFEFIDHRI